MHKIDYQYLKIITTPSKDIDMHDLYSIYRKVNKHVKQHLKEYLVIDNNLKFYSHKPKMSDLEIISLSITSECLGIDSIPIPVFKICRAPRITISRKQSDRARASRSFDSTIMQYFVGYKLHLIVSSSGVYQYYRLLPANLHDLTILKELQYTHLTNCVLIGVKSCRSHPLQLKLFNHFNIGLSSPYGENQKDFKKYPYERKITRKRIETCFSQYCDDFNLKRNYAKSYEGINTRISTKIATMTFKQYWNFMHGNKISQTKHSLAA